jgi:hypothetical protein
LSPGGGPLSDNGLLPSGFFAADDGGREFGWESRQFFRTAGCEPWQFSFLGGTLGYALVASGLDLSVEAGPDWVAVRLSFGMDPRQLGAVRFGVDVVL